MGSAGKRRDLPPGYFWILPAAIALLRLIPYVWSLLLEPPDGMAVLNIGYNPRDFLSYLAFIRQAATDWAFLWYDGFTTEPHDARFILLFHWMIGVIARALGAAPTAVLELSRVPLTFAFFWALWWFLRPLVRGSRERLATCVLVGLSGGIEGLVRLFITDVPAALNPALILQSTWPLFGWNTYQVLHNPLWIAALTIFLVVMRPVLQPDGPVGVRSAVQVGVGFFLLYWVHPYSAIVVLAVVVASPIVEWLFGRVVLWRKHGRIAAALAVPLAAIGAVGSWQAQDEVFRVASGNVFGSLQLPVFWYPLTLGAVGVVALQGARRMFESNHDSRFAILSWIAAVILLHTSPILNGYHFLLYLHLPLCVLASPVALRVFTEVRARERTVRAKAAVLFAALFVGAGLVTVESISDVRDQNLIPAAYAEIVSSLADRPAGNAFVPPALGNIIPAYTPHRVWVGHWFLTPGYSEKAAMYGRLMTEPGHPGLRSLVGDQHIRYVVAPRESTDGVLATLGGLVESRRTYGAYDLVVIGPRGPETP